MEEETRSPPQAQKKKNESSFQVNASSFKRGLSEGVLSRRRNKSKEGKEQKEAKDSREFFLQDQQTSLSLSLSQHPSFLGVSLFSLSECTSLPSSEFPQHHPLKNSKNISPLRPLKIVSCKGPPIRRTLNKEIVVESC